MPPLMCCPGGVERTARQASQAGTSKVFSLQLSTTKSGVSYDEAGVISVLDRTPFQLFLLGRGLETVTRVKFTTANNSYGGDCKEP